MRKSPNAKYLFLSSSSFVFSLSSLLSQPFSCLSQKSLVNIPARQLQSRPLCSHFSGFQHRFCDLQLFPHEFNFPAFPLLLDIKNPQTFRIKFASHSDESKTPASSSDTTVVQERRCFGSDAQNLQLVYSCQWEPYGYHVGRRKIDFIPARSSV